MIKITLIIPCFNEYNRLPETLKKVEHWLVNQKIFTIELILANDGSNDGTIEIDGLHR